MDDFLDWVVGAPLRIFAILVVAWLLGRLARRAIAKFTTSLINRTQGDAGNEQFRELLARVGRMGWLEEQRERKKQRTETLGAVLSSAATIVIWVVALMMVFAELEVNLAPLIASAGVAGIAIGFGAQSVIRDFLVGVFVIVEDQYGVGDVIEVDEVSGTVESVGLRTTRVRDVSGVLWTIPNGEIHKVGNHSQLFSISRLEVEVPYDTDVDRAIEVVQGALNEVWENAPDDATVIDEPVVLGIDAFRNNAVVLTAVLRTEPSEQWTVARRARAAIKKALDAEGIGFPVERRRIDVTGGPVAGGLGSRDIDPR